MKDIPSPAESILYAGDSQNYVQIIACKVSSHDPLHACPPTELESAGLEQLKLESVHLSQGLLEEGRPFPCLLVNQLLVG